MLNITGEAHVLSIFKKATTTGIPVADIMLQFTTSTIDKVTFQYRKDKIKATAYGERTNLPSVNSGKLGTRINIIEAEIRVNTWVCKTTGESRSAPELILHKWEKL